MKLKDYPRTYLTPGTLYDIFLRFFYDLHHLLLLLWSSYVTGYSAQQPRFVGSMKNVTVVQGKDASFTCMVESLGTHRVAWIFVNSKAILAIHDHVITNNARLSVTMNDKITWTLRIRDVTRRLDSGAYMCQINTEPMIAQMAYLEVVIPPDIIDEETSGDIMVPEGGTAKLICRATGYPPPAIIWSREDGSSIIIKESHGGKRKVPNYEGEILTLSKITRSEMGAYLCIASNGVHPTVSKKVNVAVHFHPLIQVPNQMVASPKYYDALIECLAEASPRAINYWTKETGAMIIANEKFNMSEEKLSQYGVRMKLQIRNLEDDDFRGYKCISQNSMGSTEGTIHIHQIDLTPTTGGIRGAHLPVDEHPPADSDYYGKEDSRSVEESTKDPLVGPFPPVNPSFSSGARINKFSFTFLLNYNAFCILIVLYRAAARSISL